MIQNLCADVETGFSLLNLDPKLVATLTKLGYEEPTPIQRESVPPILEGRDVVGQAATGTGKTAAFALPLVQRLQESVNESGNPSAIVLVPTRELAMQVGKAITRYGADFGVKVVAIYGGQSYGPQLDALERGVDVVVATPGRALDHLRRGTLQLDTVATIVLDEADEMLDMGFAEDLEAILAAAPAERQTVLFSATLAPRIAAIAQRHLREPVMIKIAREPVAEGAVPQIRQTGYLVQRRFKQAALARILEVEKPTAAIVFCRTRSEVDELSTTLAARGYSIESLHGGMAQPQRDRVMKKLREKAADIVIATDIAARGLDIEQLSHVINYDLPQSTDTYVHRIGRVGRAGRSGVAITIADPRDRRILQNIERFTRQPIEIADVPSVIELRARRMDELRAALAASVQAGNLADFATVLDSFAETNELRELALAALKLAFQTVNPAEEMEEIPSFRPQRERRDDRDGSSGRRDNFRERFANGPTNELAESAPGERRPIRERRSMSPRGNRPQSANEFRSEAGKPRRRGGPRMAKLFLGLGSEAGIRPQDITGAITGESGINGRDIGSIVVAERFSLVEVPEPAAAQVIEALHGAKIRGRRVHIRLDARQ